jgi:hypothetical protein
MVALMIQYILEPARDVEPLSGCFPAALLLHLDILSDLGD